MNVTYIEKQLNDPEADKARNPVKQWEINLTNEGADVCYCEQFKGKEVGVRKRMSVVVAGLKKLLPNGTWGAYADEIGHDLPDKKRINHRES